jgi:hypothetical protein
MSEQIDSDEGLSQEPWFKPEQDRALGLVCPRERCQALMCARVRDVRVVSTELGEMQFDRCIRGRAGVLLRRTGVFRGPRHVYALFLRNGYDEVSLPRPRAVSPTFCIFLDCAAVEGAVQGRPSGPLTLIDRKTDVLRRNRMLARRCWTCGFRCASTQCNFKECGRCGGRGHVRMDCRECE